MKRILFVDASESQRFLLEEELSEEGYRVVSASTNEEPLSKYREFCLDLIVLELRQKIVREESFGELKKPYRNVPMDWILHFPPMSGGI